MHVLRLRVPHLIALVFFYAASALAQQNDWLIVPGTRLGPITADTTRADLDRLFGSANVRDQTVESGANVEGPEEATVVFPNLATQAVAIFWSQSGNGKVEIAQICYQRQAGPCRWRTRSGVTLGTGLQKLEELNGRAFQIETWDYDAGGNISSWRGGKLATLFDNVGKGVYPRRLMLTVYPQAGTGPEVRKLLNEVERQKRPLLSNHPGVRSLHPAVTRITLSFLIRTQASGRR